VSENLTAVDPYVEAVAAAQATWGDPVDRAARVAHGMEICAAALASTVKTDRLACAMDEWGETALFYSDEIPDHLAGVRVGFFQRSRLWRAKLLDDGATCLSLRFVLLVAGSAGSSRRIDAVLSASCSRWRESGSCS
jgi:hypothetical protein